MQRNEPFLPNIKSKQPPKDIQFELATIAHLDAIFDLMAFRNPSQDRKELKMKCEREITQFSDGKKYGLFVATSQGKVIGLCRYFFSKDVPKEKIKYAHPEGCYCMGIMVEPNFRRMGVAKYLSEKRFEWLKNIGVQEVFSVVATDNPTSIRMHKYFGFKEIDRAEGFMNISFDCGEGILFKNVIGRD